MSLKRKITNLLFIIIGFFFLFSFVKKEEKVLTHVVDLSNQELKFYWKNEEGNIINTFESLKSFLNKKEESLGFATNGGMFKKGFKPQGLYIENGIEINKIDTIQNGYGNFYLQPNGILYLTKDNKGVVCSTKDFINENINYATQSGPMLVVKGKIHSMFNKGSKNLNIRNGVGILPNGQLIFGMSKQKINFYDFASFFKSLGCKNALYLDGYISKTYLPSKNWISQDGKFGIIIGETISKKRN